MVFLAIVPSLILALLLSSYFISLRFSDMKQRLYTRGEAITRELAAASEYALLRDDHEALQNLGDRILTYRGIQTVALYDAGGKLMNFSGAVPVPLSDFFSRHQQQRRFTITHFTTGDKVQFILPVMSDRINPRTLQFEAKNIRDGQLYRVGWVAVCLSRSQVLKSAYQAVIISLFIVLIGLGIAVLLGLKLAAQLTRSLLAVTSAVKRICDGQLQTSLKLKKLPREIKILQEGINGMALSLAKAHQIMKKRIDEATASLKKSLKLIEKQNNELDAARKKAMRADHMKSQFLANMSHEIRTPVNAVMGFSELLSHSTLDESQREYVKTVLQSSQHLLGIINDILDFSKIESGALELESRPFELQAQIEDTLMLFRPVIMKKQLDFALFIDPRLPEKVIGDALRFSQIISNLVSNALKFTAEGGVRFRARMEKRESDKVTFRLCVSDSGIGMDDVQIKHLFQAFNQGDVSTSRKYGGTGLGLAISKNLIEKMGGEIKVRSQINRGTTFQIKLTLKTVSNINETLPSLKNQKILILDQTRFSAKALAQTLHACQAEVVCFKKEEALIDALAEAEALNWVVLAFGELPDANTLERSLIMDIHSLTRARILLIANQSDDVLETYKNNSKCDVCFGLPFKISRFYTILLSDKSALTTAQASEDKVQLSSPHTVLVVDDHPVNLRLLKLLLERQGLSVYAADSGKAALAIVQETQVDLVLSDVHMPEMDGETLCRKLRALPNYRQTPMIAVTADVVEKTKSDLLKVGFDAVETKPMGEKQLVALINKFLGGEKIADACGQKCVNPAKIEAKLIDIAGAGALLGTNEQFVKEMLAAFMKTLPEALNALERAYLEQEGVRLKMLVHKLHGASGYCGVPQLKAALAALERALAFADNSVTEEVSLSYQRFISVIQKTVQAYQKLR